MAEVGTDVRIDHEIAPALALVLENANANAVVGITTAAHDLSEMKSRESEIESPVGGHVEILLQIRVILRIDLLLLTLLLLLPPKDPMAMRTEDQTQIQPVVHRNNKG